MRVRRAGEGENGANPYLVDGLVQTRPVVVELVVVGEDDCRHSRLHEGRRVVNGVLHLKLGKRVVEGGDEGEADVR